MVLLIFGCSKETDSAVVTMKASPVYYAYPNDLNWSSDKITMLEDSLSLPVFADDGTVVDNNVFNFLMIIPLTTKDDIAKIFKLYKIDSVPVTMRKCSSGRAYAIANTDLQMIDNNGTYHYMSFGRANALKAKGYFDKIDDLCLRLGVSEDTQTQKYDYTSNTVIILAQEIKDMLDELGIPYE